MWSPTARRPQYTPRVNAGQRPSRRGVRGRGVLGGDSTPAQVDSLPTILATPPALLRRHRLIGRGEAGEKALAVGVEGALQDGRACAFHQAHQEAQVVDAGEPIIEQLAARVVLLRADQMVQVAGAERATGVTGAGRLQWAAPGAEARP